MSRSQRVNKPKTVREVGLPDGTDLVVDLMTVRAQIMLQRQVCRDALEESRSARDEFVKADKEFRRQKALAGVDIATDRAKYNGEYFPTPNKECREAYINIKTYEAEAAMKLAKEMKDVAVSASELERSILSSLKAMLNDDAWDMRNPQGA